MEKKMKGEKGKMMDDRGGLKKEKNRFKSKKRKKEAEGMFRCLKQQDVGVVMDG